MILWHSPTCDCVMQMATADDAAGWERRCAVHSAAADPSIVPNRCRARELARARIKGMPGGRDDDEPLTEFDAAERVIATHIDLIASKMTQETVAPLTKAQYVAAIEALRAEAEARIRG